jgi:hypothetical protein
MKMIVFFFSLLVGSVAQAELAWLSESRSTNNGSIFFEHSRTVEFCRSASRERGCLGKIPTENLDFKTRIELVEQALRRIHSLPWTRYLTVELQEGNTLEILRELYRERLRTDRHIIGLESFVANLSGYDRVFVVETVYGGGMGYEEWGGSPYVYDLKTNRVYAGKLHYFGGED